MARCGLALMLIFFSVLSQAQKVKTLKPSEISKLLPSKVKGYSVKESKSSVLEIGSLRYSLCERIFFRKDQTIKLLLFDYVEAPVMFNQSVKKWQQMHEVHTDSISFSSVEISQGVAWQSERLRSNRCQVIAGVNNRFFLTVEGENLPLTQLNEFFKNVDLTKFPE